MNLNLHLWKCQSCGRSFDGRKRKFCTIDCAGKAKRRRDRVRVRTQQRCKRCVGCGADFITASAGRTFCTNKCRDLNYPKQLLPCPRCGKEFWPWASGKHARKFCCKSFRKIRVAPIANCSWCGKSFSQKAGQHYCSLEC